jgi:crossover junction endodeoxyribonuclease RuvC
VSDHDRFVVLGVDPGVDGAFAFIDPVACTLRVADMPCFTRTTTKTKRFADAVGIGNLVRSEPIVHCYIEKVASSPQMGVVSAFSFGYSFGTLHGALSALQVPLDEVPPQEWKKAMRTTADKKESKARAHQLMPQCVKLLGRADRAEAAMLALYGTMLLGHKITKPLTPVE